MLQKKKPATGSYSRHGARPVNRSGYAQTEEAVANRQTAVDLREIGGFALAQLSLFRLCTFLRRLGRI